MDDNVLHTLTVHVQKHNLHLKSTSDPPSAEFLIKYASER